MPSQMRNIAIDFDGVLHRYSKGWCDGDIYDDPIEGAAYAYKKLIEKGYHVIVFTARKDLDSVVAWIKEKLDISDPIVTREKPQAIAYIDDRGIRFTNWQDILKYF